MASKKLVYVDMDDVLCDYTGAYQAKIELNPGVNLPVLVPVVFRGSGVGLLG